MRKFSQPIWLLLFLLPVINGLSQQYVAKKDMQSEWLVSGESGFVPYSASGESSNVIYLSIKTPHPLGEFLSLKGLNKFTIFINNKLAAQGTHMTLDLDSLADVYLTNQLLIGIHQKGLHKETLYTGLLSRTLVTQSTMTAEVRPSYFFRDFGILAALCLTVLVVVAIRLNPKLAADYFSIGKIFSLREDEAQLANRIGSSTNILFYIYCSLLIGYYFIVIFQYLPAHFKVSLLFQSETFIDAVLQWIKLSSIILVLLFVKIILILNLSFLFGITGVGGLHFFNWIRLMVVFFGILTLILFVYFIGHGYSAETHSFFLKLVVWIMGIWIILVFLKLSGRANASMFHLFSYICATELIPFLLIIKVLYN